MPLAAAAVGGIAQIGGAFIGGKAQNKAAKKALKAQQEMTQLNNALAQWNYQQNAARLDPYAAGGVRAGSVLNSALLGPAPAAGAGGGSGYFPSAPPPGMPYDIVAMNSDGIKGNYKQAAAMWNAQQAANANQPQGPVTSGPIASADNTVNPQSALDQYLQSTNYQFNFNEGQRALNNGLGATMMDSGAARRAEIEYGGNMARNGIGDWMDRLYQQQQLGANAAGNLAGVGNTLTQGMTANNQMSADAAGNSALVAGNSAANLWGNVGAGISKLAGAYGSSYGNSGYGGTPPDLSGANANYGDASFGSWIPGYGRG